MSVGLPLNPQVTAKQLNNGVLGKLASGAKLISSIAPAAGGYLSTLGAIAPVGIGIGALGALGYGGYKMYKNWKDKNKLPHPLSEEDIIAEGANGRKIFFKDKIYEKGKNLYLKGAEWSDTKGRELLNKGLTWSASTGRDIFNRGANWSNTRGKELLNSGIQAGKQLSSDVVKFVRT